MTTGERIFAGVFALLGLSWIVQSLNLRYWGDFAPGPGFLPLWLGVTLMTLVAIHVCTSLRVDGRRDADARSLTSPSGRVAAIVIGFLLCIASIDWLGFGVAVMAYLVYLLWLVERQTPAVVAGVSLGTTVALYLIFKVWLGVPLPAGPWGF